MKTITVQKDALVARIQENRDKHSQVYKEAVEKYREEVLNALNKEMDRMRASAKPRSVSVYLNIPEDHTSDYDAVLDMLEMETAEEIEISEADFRTYARDEWAWKKAWISNTANYTQYAGDYNDD